VAIPRNATVVNVAGKTVIPGLIDMHGHRYARGGAKMSSQFEAYPLLYLAGGVTTVRSPGDFEPEGTIALRDRIARGEAVGPRIFAGGPYFDHEPSEVGWIKGRATPEESLALFQEWKGRIDVVKAYTRITEAQLAALIQDAHAAGLPVTGHLDSVTATRAIELGIDGLEHGLFAMSDLVKQPEKWDPMIMCAYQDIDVDGPKVDAIIALIVRKHVVIDPTVAIPEALLPNPPPVLADWTKYLTPEAREHREKHPWIFIPPDSPAVGCLERAVKKQLRFIKKLHDKGGIIVAGTDPVVPQLVPGYGLHRELKLFVEAGLTPVEAIRTGSLNAAVALRRDKDFGSVAVGKLADRRRTAGARSAGDGAPPAPQRGRGLRDRPRGRAALRGHGAGRGRHVAQVDGRGAHVARSGGDVHARRARAGGGAQGRAGAPRLQTRQRARRQRRAAARDRLRAGRRSCGNAVGDRLVWRDPRVHVAGAGARPAGRRALRSVLV
jgi:enamidase